MLQLDDTLFFQSRRFRWLRYLVAASVVCFYFAKVLYSIVIEAYYLSQNGPAARSSDFVFGLDDLIVALIPAAILISELEILAKPKTYHFLRMVCIMVGVIAMLSGCFFLREVAHMLDFDYFEIGLAAHILRQITIFFAAVYLYNRIILLKTEADITND